MRIKPDTKRWFLIVSILFSALFIVSMKEGPVFDDLPGRLKTQLKDYLTEHPVYNLYVHLDKNIYSSSETIWFKAYLLSGSPLKSTVLYIKILDREKKIVHEQKFPVYDIRSHGDIILPDSLTDGKYFLYAYTDMMMNFQPRDVFVQPIEIFNYVPDKLDAEISVKDPAKLRRGEKVEVAVKIFDKGLGIKDAKGEYTLFAGNKGLSAGKLTTNKFGEAFIIFTYPKIDDSESLKLHVKFRKESIVSEATLNLRHEGNIPTIKAYPEGGHLLEGISNNIVFEAIDVNQNPLSILLCIKNGQTIIGSVKTNKNGIGRFRFTPKKNIRYTIEEQDSKTPRPID
ncbi:MAG: hypothetical protein H7Y07_09980, partial [Pyrinomonadaceae bacterium]|nr:hypothetical protein [Sphingobacteriaceae bacterium]